MTLEEAEAWLWKTAGEPDKAIRTEYAARESAGIPTIYPKDPPMWGPEEYASWTHDELVWRLVFLQCVCRRMDAEQQAKSSDR